MMTQLNSGACWRSYQVFYGRGGVKKHDRSNYRELSIKEDGECVLKQSTPKVVTRSYRWQLEAIGKQRYLFINGKKQFEVITLEADELVLMEPISGTKFFYTSLPLWPERIHPKPAAKATEDHSITLWSPSLISCIKQ